MSVPTAPAPMAAALPHKPDVPTPHVGPAPPAGPATAHRPFYEVEASHPATLPPDKDGKWSIWSIQRSLPWVPPAAGVHSYLAIAAPDGKIAAEYHGMPSEHFTGLGPEKGNYLVTDTRPANGYMGDQAVKSRTEVLRGDSPAIATAWLAATKGTDKAIAADKPLYDGVEVVGHATNSNSVWATTLKGLGEATGLPIDPRKFATAFATPGSQVDLRTTPTNNRFDVASPAARASAPLQAWSRTAQPWARQATPTTQGVGVGMRPGQGRE